MAKVGEYGQVGGVMGRATERDIMQEIARNGPVVMSMAVDYPFMLYKGGVYSPPPGQWGGSKTLAHLVLCYGWGFDTRSNSKYWLLRNSWGKEWGHQGDFKVLRGHDILSIESSPEYAIPYFL